MRYWIGRRMVRLGLRALGHDWRRAAIFVARPAVSVGWWAAQVVDRQRADPTAMPADLLLPGPETVAAYRAELDRLNEPPAAEPQPIPAGHEMPADPDGPPTPVDLPPTGGEPPTGGPFGLCTCDICRDARLRQPACCCSAHLPPILSVNISPAEVQAVQDYLDSTPLPLGKPVALRDGFTVERIDPPEFSFRTPDGDRAVLLILTDGSWKVFGEGYVAARTRDSFYLTHIPLDEIVTAHARGCLRVLPQDDDTGEFTAAPGMGNPVG